MTQEERIEKVVEEFEKNIASCSLTETDICCGIEQLSKLHVEDWLRNTLATIDREAREESSNEIQNALRQVIQGAPGRVFVLPHNVEKVFGYIHEAELGDVAYKGKEIDLQALADEAIKLAITPNTPSH
jgi:Mg2+/Co2+ transporter CorB